VTLALANRRQITISEVYYAKSFGNTCLLSIPQLAKKGAEVQFKSNKVAILDRGLTVTTGTLCKRSGLYRLDQIGTTARVYRATVTSSGNTMMDWHRRYGHTNYRYIRKTQECVTGLNIEGPDPMTCEPCLIGKSTFSHMAPVDEKGGVLYIVHIDHWGPARIQSILGNSY
jgi:hypothetical protein